jgi:hypothetical protein
MFKANEISFARKIVFFIEITCRMMNLRAEELSLYSKKIENFSKYYNKKWELCPKIHVFT